LDSNPSVQAEQAKTEEEMPVYIFEGRKPKPDAFVCPEAVIIGKVTIESGCFIAPGAVLRGDWAEIVVCEGSNIQDNAVIHARPGSKAYLGKGSHIGHGAIIHGCTIAGHALIGMGAVVNDGAIIGERSVIASGALVPPGMEIPSGSVAMGIPAKITKALNKDMESFLTIGTGLYQTLPKRYDDSLIEVSLSDCT